MIKSKRPINKGLILNKEERFPLAICFLLLVEPVDVFLLNVNGFLIFWQIKDFHAVESLYSFVVCSRKAEV
jgi:hypothetical protein